MDDSKTGVELVCPVVSRAVALARCLVGPTQPVWTEVLLGALDCDKAGKLFPSFLYFWGHKIVKMLEMHHPAYCISFHSQFGSNALCFLSGL